MQCRAMGLIKCVYVLAVLTYRCLCQNVWFGCLLSGFASGNQLTLPMHTHTLTHYVVGYACMLFGNSNVTSPDAHFHTSQADDRTKAALFVERYDKAMADPATKLKVHRVSHYLASGALGLDLRAHATGSPMSKKARQKSLRTNCACWMTLCRKALMQGFPGLCRLPGHQNHLGGLPLFACVRILRFASHWMN